MERTYVANKVTATDEENDAISYSISGGADANFFNIDTNTGALTFSGVSNTQATPLIALPNDADKQPSVLFDNFVVDGTIASMDVYVLPKSAGFDALSGVQMAISSDVGSVSFAQDNNTTSGFFSIGNAGNIALAKTTADLQANKIGTATISDYSSSAVITVSGIVFDGGSLGSSNTSNKSLSDLTLTPIVTPPSSGANASADADDVYSVKVTATDANGAASEQTIQISITATENSNYASVTNTWTGTSSSDTFTIDIHSGLTITADGKNGGADTAKIAALDHVLWDMTSNGTTELIASLVDMEVIDIGAVVKTHDAIDNQLIGDFSTHLLLDSTSTSALTNGSDHAAGAISIYGTSNDMVTLKGNNWSRTENDASDTSIDISSDYFGEVVDKWQLIVDNTTHTLYIDNDINVITPDL